MRKYRVSGSYQSKTRSYIGLWTVPSLSGYSMLYSTGHWHKAVVYAMCRTFGVRHHEAVRLARKATPADLRPGSASSGWRNYDIAK